jgi:hypothetical protein
MFSGANATASNRYGEMRYSGAGSTGQHAVALLGKKVALREIAHQALVDRRAFEYEIIEILCQGKFGDPDLVLD